MRIATPDNRDNHRATPAATTLTDHRWQAVLTRDPASDGSFFYSVATTGVYCRPSCAARQPRPENVRFYATTAEAERAGFRPCKRCRPNEAPLAAQQAERIAEVCRLIEQSEQPAPLDQLAAHAGLSVFHFHRLFKSITGLTPRQYQSAHRARRVRDHLRPGVSVTDAIYNAGFNSNSRFYESSGELLGMTPSRFRAGGAQTEILFGVAPCSLGSLLVAQSDRGICAILLGDDPAALVQDLERRFPKATLLAADPGFGSLLAKVVDFVEAPAIGLDLPLDIRGTAFQQRVWQALQKIPAGSQSSYAAVAAALGSPQAVRAVAQACAANSLAVAVPCHRVVRSDGALGGYRWGLDRKRALLEKEGAKPHYYR